LDKIKAYREANNLVTEGELEAKTKKLQGTESKPEPEKKNLYDAHKLDGRTNPSGTSKQKTKEDINRVTGQANQIKKIDIRIDSIHKGDNNVTNEGGKAITIEDLNKWYADMMQRIIINAENA
jgi:hypothetical protein